MKYEIKLNYDSMSSDVMSCLLFWKTENYSYQTVGSDSVSLSSKRHS